MEGATRSRFGVVSSAQADEEHQASAEAGETGTRLERLMIPGQSLMSRRGAIGGGLAGLAGLGTLLLSPSQVLANEAVVHDPFVIIIKGLYHPVVNGPNLGLSTVNINDGSFSEGKVFAITGIPGHNDPKAVIGSFYVQFTGDLCAYRLPGGNLAMRFTGVDDDFPTAGGAIVPDGHGGAFWNGTLELTILEATGRYRSFAGGHNHMQDRLHVLKPGDFSGGANEHCICNISKP